MATVEPRFTDTPLLRTVFFCPWEASTFSLNSTRLIRRPVNAENGHLFLAQSTDVEYNLTS